MIIAKTGDSTLDSQPDGTFVAYYNGTAVGIFKADGRKLVADVSGSHVVAEEFTQGKTTISVGEMALRLSETSLYLADWRKKTKSTLDVTLTGSTIIIRRDDEEVGKFSWDAEGWSGYGWKGTLLGRTFSPYATDPHRLHIMLDDFEARLKKAGLPSFYIRDIASGAFYINYGEPTEKVKQRAKEERAQVKVDESIRKKHAAALSKLQGPARWEYEQKIYAEMVATRSGFHRETFQNVVNMTDPKKGPVGAKKFKRFADVKMHMLYLVGHFNPSRSHDDDGWHDEYDDLPEFLMNSYPIPAIPENWEIVSIAEKGAAPVVVMTSDEILAYVARQSRLKVLTDKFGSVVKAVYGKLETSGKIDTYPYVLLLLQDDPALDAAFKDYGIAKSSYVKVSGKKSDYGDGPRKIAIAVADTSTAFMLRSALTVQAKVLDMLDLSEAVAQNALGRDI